MGKENSPIWLHNFSILFAQSNEQHQSSRGRSKITKWESNKENWWQPEEEGQQFSSLEQRVSRRESLYLSLSLSVSR